MNVVTIIPARGGSKRFPGKNTYPLAGKPLIAHPIEAAIKAGVGRVLVSTDDEYIASVARTYGAEVPFLRPSALARDATPVIDAIRFTVDELERREHDLAEFVLLLQATTPLIEADQIKAALDLATAKGADSVVTVVEVDTINHPYNVRSMQEDGTIRFWQEELHYTCVGSARPKFYHAANLWLSSVATIRAGKLEGKKNFPIIVPPVYSSDIDYKEDLERIAALLEYASKH